MKNISLILLLPIAALLLFSGCASQDKTLTHDEMPPAYNADVPPRWFADTGMPVWPKLPPYIRKVQDYGQRAELNADGSRLLYVTKRKGEVEELNLETGEVTQISTFPRPENTGFYRAYFLANGDYLLTGGRGRSVASIWWVSKDLTRYKHIGDRAVEGIAVSPNLMRIAWTRSAGEVIRMADIKFDESEYPELVNSRPILSIDDSLAKIPEYQDRKRTYFEPQNFLPSNPNILTFAHYGTGPYQAETLTYNYKTGEVVHHTPGDAHGEPEGVLYKTSDPLVMLETNFLRGDNDYGNDIVILKLDGTAEHMVRITYLARSAIFSATNPTASQDGKWVAFQAANNHNAGPGSGRALYIMDVQAAMMEYGQEFSQSENP